MLGKDASGLYIVEQFVHINKVPIGSKSFHTSSQISCLDNNVALSASEL